MKKFFAGVIAVVFSMIQVNAQEGSLDATFGTGGYTTTSFADVNSESRGMVLQPDGRIVLGGYYLKGGVIYLAASRYTISGQLDPTFGVSGKTEVYTGFSSGALAAVGLQSDGKILAAGTIDDKPAILRLNSNGGVDNTFGTLGFVTFSNNMFGITDMKVIPGNKMVGCGLGSLGSGNLLVVFRRNADGSQDNTFGTNGFTYTQLAGQQLTVTHMMVQSDGKILVTGTIYSNAASLYDLVIVRYNPNGTLDDSFGSNGKVIAQLGVPSAYEMGTRMITQPDGKILVTSRVSNVSPTIFNISRFNGDGTMDNDFGANGTASVSFYNNTEEARSLALQTDGKIIVVGNALNGITRELAMARLNQDGSLDVSFGTGGKVTTLVGTRTYGENVIIQNDHNIVVSGYATVSSLSQFIVLRYNAQTVATQSPDNPFSDLKAYPNPVQDNYLQLDFTLRTDASVRLRIYDATGRVVTEENPGFLTGGENHLSVALMSGLPAGTYVATLVSEDGQFKSTLFVVSRQ